MAYRYCLSRQGHDKDTLYIIIEETQKGFLLSDGKYHPIEKPKLKNPKHIQRTNILFPSNLELTNDNIRCEIKKVLKTKEN